KFEKGRVYVVEIWAIWCGPCIAMMPHVAELQEQYKKDVTVIGFTAKDKNNPEHKVADLVKKRGKTLKYAFAFPADRQASDTYSRSSPEGLACWFVVDRAGKIAFIGHPMFLDLVLPKVVSGKWDAKAGVKQIDKIDKEVDTLLEALDDDGALEKVVAFEK